MQMEKYERTEKLTEILFNLQGISDILRAVQNASEKDQYGNAMYVLQHLLEEQCGKIKEILEYETADDTDEVMKRC